MPQDKASQFQQAGQLESHFSVGSLSVFSCLRCGALVLADDREHHLVWHLLLRTNFCEIADWLEPGEV